MLYVHIGRNKTGSTAIQYALSDNRHKLAERGYFYPGSTPNHQAIAYALNRRASARISREMRPAFVQAAESLRTQIHAHQGTSIISSEGLSNVPAAALRNWLGNADMKVVVYIREQVEYMASMYQQAVKGGNVTASFEEYIARFKIDYEKILLGWEREFGPDNLIVRPYDKTRLVEGNVVADFLQVIGIPDHRNFKSERSDPNPSVRGALLEAKRRINRLGFGRRDMIRGCYTALLELANERPDFKGLIGVPPALVLEIRARYAESNRAVARKYLGVDELFTLRPIPEDAAVDQTRVDEAVKLLLERTEQKAPLFAQRVQRRTRMRKQERIARMPAGKRRSG
jgi:hypothetical protein